MSGSQGSKLYSAIHDTPKLAQSECDQCVLRCCFEIDFENKIIKVVYFNCWHNRVKAISSSQRIKS